MYTNIKTRGAGRRKEIITTPAGWPSKDENRSIFEVNSCLTNAMNLYHGYVPYTQYTTTETFCLEKINKKYCGIYTTKPTFIF